jgi:hypothetical protein
VELHVTRRVGDVVDDARNAVINAVRAERERNIFVAVVLLLVLSGYKGRR